MNIRFYLVIFTSLLLCCTGCKEGNSSSKDKQAHHVLCIGNSITSHSPYNAVNWYSDQGMAASKPENDYCHVLESLMRTDNPETTVNACNIASWERDFSLDLDALLGQLIKGMDIVVIRLGENVPVDNVPLFSGALTKLIEYCKQYTDHIVLTGQYWPSERKEEAVRENAEKFGLPYVELSWIWKDHREECSPKEGDIIYDVNGNPYPIVGKFILTHPNDKGMEYIANAIYEKI